VPGLSRLEELQIQQEVEATEPFDPKNVPDGRKRILSAVIRRLGQQAFRRKLISAYASQCALTQCKTLWVLEAAHISPYRGIRTNSVTNGLLLRADVHTLFDLILITIEPSKFLVQVSKLLEGSPYEALDGQQPRTPAKTALCPSAAALEYHYRQFQP
jgi:predicted restriction endonuclease